MKIYRSSSQQVLCCKILYKLQKNTILRNPRCQQDHLTMGTCLNVWCRVWGWGLTPGCHQIFLINGRWTRRQVSSYDYKLGKQRAITTDIWDSGSFTFYFYLVNFHCVHYIFNLCEKTITQIYQISPDIQLSIFYLYHWTFYIKWVRYIKDKLKLYRSC